MEQITRLFIAIFILWSAFYWFIAPSLFQYPAALAGKPMPWGVITGMYFGSLVAALFFLSLCYWVFRPEMRNYEINYTRTKVKKNKQ